MMRRRRTLPMLAMAALVMLSTLTAAKEDAWRHDTADAFEKGRRERVVVSDAGILRLSRSIEATGDLDAARVWALARSRDGAIFAATGDAGKVFRKAGDGAWAVAYDSDDTQVLALTATPDGQVFAGTGPSGGVVELINPEHPVSRPDPKVQYIWALASGSDGTLYAATGPEGQLWKRPAGRDDWSLVLDTPQKHLLCVAVAPEGTVFAGSDGEGLVYRVAKDGEVSVLLDADEEEIRALVVGPDGALYVGTAAGGDDSGPDGLPTRTTSRPDDSTSVRPASLRREANVRPVQDRGRSRSGNATANAVYRIDPDGSARKVFQTSGRVYALALQRDGLLVGTGPEGRLFEVRDAGRETVELARVDHGQVLALLAGKNNEVWLGLGDPGGVLRLEPSFAKSGTLTSDVLDASLASRFGVLRWRGETPAGTSIHFQLRTGNVGEPDKTWSDWSPPLSDSDGARPDVPPGRFAQYRATLETSDPSRTPELRAVALYYRTINQSPRVTEINVPDLSDADGAATEAKLALKWKAEDPNNDDLIYSLAIRKDGWPAWVVLDGAKELTETSYTWDTDTVPAGYYRLRVEASDRPSNRPDEVRTGRRESVPFVVDHRAPVVSVTARDGGRSAVAELRDDLTRIVSAEYALDGGEWTPLFPDDGLFDTPNERVSVDWPDLARGPHVLLIRARDSAGNLGSGDAVLRSD